MQLKIVNSNSAGNCYILENETEALLIECGVSFKKILHALDFKISKVRGCIVSHEHLDHCKAAGDLAFQGINIYASLGTIESFGEYHHRYHPISKHVAFELGGFRILPFDVKHDAAEPLCFLIKHEECGLVLFLTDSYYVEYVFSDLNNVIVEANYCEQILAEKVASGTSPQILKDRVLQSHMSIKTCKQFLRANDLSQVNNIVLIHLSDNHSDAARFQQEVLTLTGKTVHVAEAGMVIDNFNKTPF
jgi:phosphoribosyl 1,2-cyclic phosphodiesterase